MARKPIPEVNGWGDEIVTALGALVIRASHHEASLISLLSAVAGIRRAQGWAMFYATTNAKARLDLIRALLGVSDLSGRCRRRAEALLEKSKSLADRRNIYVHSEHSIEPHPGPTNPARPVMSQYQSATTNRVKVRPLVLSHLHQLLDDYTTANGELSRYVSDAWAIRERREARMAKKTA